MNNFKVPAIFCKEYIDNLAKLNNKYKSSQVIETYGCLPYGKISSSRVGTQLPEVTIDKLKEYIAYSLEKQIDFNYIMNTTCHGNESHENLNKMLHEEIISLLEVGVKNITASTPYLIQFLHNNYPEINIIASINMCVSSVAQVLQLQNMGVGKVVLDRNINRNYKLLKEIKRNCDVDLELLTNSLCLPFCIMHQYHNNLNSHYQSGTDDKLVKVYPYSECITRYVENPIFMICSGWIRPEDLTLYTDLGIDKFKIDGRGIPQSTILEVIEPYMRNEWKGNIFDLMFSGRASRRTISAYLDNEILETFLLTLFEDKVDCRYCGGKNIKCMEIAKQITFDEEKRAEYIKENKKDTQMLFEEI